MSYIYLTFNRSGVMATKEKWLERSFEIFAEYGPRELHIQKIASDIGVPRTSFYYHFSDKEDLINQLLEKFLEMTEDQIQLGKQYCRTLIPDLHEVLAMNITGIKFNRQLFLNRANPVYNMVFIKARERANKVIIPLFIEYYRFNLPYSTAEDLWNSLAESWYSRLDPNNMTADSMRKLTEEIMVTIMSFARTKLFGQMQDH